MITQKSHRSTLFSRSPVWARSLILVLVLAILGACQADPVPAAAPPEAAQSEQVSETAVPFDPMALPTALPATGPVDIPDAVPEDLATAWEVWSLLTEQHVDRGEFDSDKFDEGAIRGILAALGDTHTNYVPPEAFQIENQDLYGSFEGIGAHVQMNAAGKLLIVTPMEGSPAKLAGLRPGDVVLEVNGESIAGLSLLEAVNKIRGPKGSEVTLLVLHLGAASEVEISVVRGNIPLPSVIVRNRPEDRFAHIRLTTFYGDTPEKLANAIEEQQQNGVEGLILDVRDNPGGLLSSVVQVVSMFIDDELILYEVDGAGQRTDHRAHVGGQFADLPLVVLANGGSASASEIIVGALQDHGRAPIVGDTTFGKGSVNRLYRLGNGGGLYLTFGKWYTPNGQLIHGNGIDPDHPVTSRDRQKADTSQFEKAVEVMEALLDGAAGGGA